ncbi:MAG: M18 family aminopeptidase, partial [Actinobacteria bacterium]|nr:M18 family aminopeptidase [Actinomycetota bacterium]
MTTAEQKTVQNLCAFIDASPSPFHVVQTAANQLATAGFTEIFTTSEAAGDHPVYLRRDGALLAAAGTGTQAAKIIGAHTDSPNLRLKPNPDQTASGWRSLGIEVYGGTLNNTWLDRDLGCSGRLIVQDPDALREVLVLLD